MRRRLAGRTIGASLALLGLVVIWSTFAPATLGGQSSYVITQGVSMLPNYRADGLVIARQEDAYGIGDVVAYRNQRLHTIVMHRIVGRAGDRFVLEGDNNDYRDRYHPTESEILGKEWVYWPGVGRYLRLLRDPLTFAVIIAAVAGLSLRPARGRRRKGSHHA